MRYDELEKLHYIAPIENMKSICTMGILSHKRVQKIKHTFVAIDEIHPRSFLFCAPNLEGFNDSELTE